MTENPYIEMDGQARGVAAIKYLHRKVREAIKTYDHPDATEVERHEAVGAVAVCLGVLEIMRPDMSREQIIAAAKARIAKDAKAS